MPSEIISEGTDPENVESSNVIHTQYYYNPLVPCLDQPNGDIYNVSYTDLLNTCQQHSSVEFTSHGIECRVVLISDNHYCGYWNLPNTHPYYEIDSNTLTDHMVAANVSIPHGGITAYHGFDCAHAYDLGLVHNYLFGYIPVDLNNHSFKTWTYAEYECRRISEWLASISE